MGERDVGAVFGVLQKFGGEDALTDLEKYSEQYQYYAVLALGNMPDGAGLSSLMTMLRDPEAASARGPVLQMLAQLSLDSPQALNMLLDQARQNQITSSTWVSISQILSGERLQMGTPPPDSDARTFHVATGNQNLYMLPGQSEWTPDEINRYKDVLKQLADASPNPTAATSLKTALGTWETRIK